MLKPYPDYVNKKMDILYKLMDLNSDALNLLKYGTNKQSAEVLDLIIKEMEDPESLANLKALRDWVQNSY